MSSGMPSLDAQYWLHDTYLRVYPLLVNSVISSALFGTTTALEVATAYAILRKGLDGRMPKVLFASSVVLYVSTSLFFAFSTALLFVGTRYSFAYASFEYSCNVHCDPSDYPNALKNTEDALHLGITITFMINMLVGDLIVWWRALLVWRYNKIILAFGAVVLLVCVVFGLIATHTTPNSAMYQIGNYQSTTFFFGDKAGFACIILSLVSNVLATALISYKTWQHWKFVQSYLARAYFNSHALGSLMLVIESGVMYCTIWIFVTFAYGVMNSPAFSSTTSSFGMSVIFRVVPYVPSFLIPIIAMYPMAIIIVIAFRRSPLDEVAIQTFGSHGGSAVLRAHSRQSTAVGDSIPLGETGQKVLVIRQERHAASSSSCVGEYERHAV
ncbi:uncharacterized protein BXZ73DRAFT_99937 [Epithele typhae]|uniref:uncharacterized protein n=1 Tax=Epithele typhae TaxID=378194 RepID=UPI002007D73C|nr:uncharacterized protein BXZ73DRAFT_99937 [Epithele typhae]KAH9938876.1 hypothetical protein BXZ73DRAFT_99937 [Epithele typhae]